MADNYTEQIVRHMESNGPIKGSAGVGIFLVEATAVAAVLDLFASAIMDREPAINKAFAGDWDEALIQIFYRISPMPLYTDALFRMYEGRGRFGQGSLTDAVTGPVGSMIRDLNNAFKSRDVEGKLRVWFHDHIIPNPWWVSGPARHLDVDTRESMKRGKIRKPRRNRFTLEDVGR